MKQPPRYFHDREPLRLESGEIIDNLTIAYHTYGRLNEKGDNAVWVCHALTADSEVADWWPHTVEAGKFLDPDRFFVVCANILGSHYGTTGPVTPTGTDGKGEPLYGDFPGFTVRDIVAAHRRLAAHLGLSSVRMLIGSSLGGFQCMEWALADPSFARNVVLIATAPYTTPWAAAFNESQRMAIEADSTFGERNNNAGSAGLSCARSVALLSYRGSAAYNATQKDDEDIKDDIWRRRVHSYQRHQGEKLCDRFNAYSYYRLSQAVDSHNVGRDRGGIAEALRTFRPRTLVVAISSDILFPPEDHTPFVKYIPDNRYVEINSTFGHDGFLIEHELLNGIISDFLEGDS